MGRPHHARPVRVAPLGFLLAAVRGGAAPRFPLTCPGTIDVEGYGPVSIVPTGWPEENLRVNVVGNYEVAPRMGSRAYFSNTCIPGVYDRFQYVALNLLGKTLRYTVDLSAADAMGGACSSPDLDSLEGDAVKPPPDEAPPRDVPWIWVQHVTPDLVLVFSPEGQPYYHNIRTQTSTWPRKPEELKMAHALQVRWMNEQAASMIGSSRAAAGRGDSAHLVPSPETIEQQRRENEAKLDRQLEAALDSNFMRQCEGQEAKSPTSKRPADGPSPGPLLDNEIEVTVPDDAREGEKLAIYHLGLKFSVLVPLGCAGGSVLRVSLFLEFRQAEGHRGVRIFEEPLQGATPLDTVPCGERTPCTARSGEFMRVNVGQFDGWVGRKNVVPLPGVVVHAKVPPVVPEPALLAADAPPPPPTHTDPTLPSSWHSQQDLPSSWHSQQGDMGAGSPVGTGELQEAADRAGVGRKSSEVIHEAVPLPRSCKSETSIPTSVGSTACEVPMRHTYPESELSGLCSPPRTPSKKRSKIDPAFSSGA